MINGFSEAQISASKGKNRKVAEGYELPIFQHLISEPPHLIDPDHGKAPRPADGENFVPAGVWYYDPITGEPFEANGFGFFESFALIVRERPGHPLKPCPRTTARHGVVDLLRFLDEMYSLNQFWASSVCSELKKRGVRITGSLTEWHPDDIQIYAVEDYTKQAEEEVRTHFKKLALDPEGKLSEVDKRENKRLVENRRKRVAEELGRLRLVGKMTLEQDLQERWSRVIKQGKEGGLPPGKVQQLFEACCKDLKVEIGLAPEPMAALEKAVAAELGLIKAQAEAPPPVAAAVVKEQALEAARELVPATEEWKLLVNSAKKYNITEDQLKAWQSQFAVNCDPYSAQVIDKINIEIAQILAGNLSTVTAEDLPTAEPDAPRSSDSDGALFADSPAEEATQEATPEAAAPKAKEKKASKPKAPRVDGQHSIESVMITNQSSGEAKTLNQVMRQRFDLLADIAAIEARIEMYVNQQKAKLSDIQKNLHGWEFCYGTQVAEAVREQFEKQRQPNGTFKPATIKTEYATFKRNPEAAAVCIDDYKFQEWANNVPEEERCLFGDAISVTVKGSKSGASKEVLSGASIPGWIVKESVDDIGVPKIELSKTRANVSEDDEDEITPPQTIEAQEQSVA